MNENQSERAPIRAFIRGTWILIVLQFAIALLLFGMMTYASFRLIDVLRKTAEIEQALEAKQTELDDVRQNLEELQVSRDEARESLRRARASTPLVRDAIISYHNRRYQRAVALYDEALRLDPDNVYVLDLKSYSEYRAGLAARNLGNTETAEAYFDEATKTIEQALDLEPRNLNGYIQLAIYSCASDENEKAIASYQDAISRFGENAGAAFSSRINEFPVRCTGLRELLTE